MPGKVESEIRLGRDPGLSVIRVETMFHLRSRLGGEIHGVW